MYRTIGFRNRLYLCITGESIWLDIGRRRFHLRWFSAEDGRTWDWAVYTHRRDWTY